MNQRPSSAAAAAPPTLSLDIAPGEEEQLERVLREARQLQGTSLTQDAWRRLKKNRVARWSLWYLAVLALLAFLAPALPLQPPRWVDTARQFQPPSLAAARLPVAAATRGQGAAGNPTPDNAAPGNAGPRQPAPPPGLDDPVIRQGFGPLGPVGRTLLRLRLAVFGRWCVPSLCGTDNLGRDLLARLFWGARVSIIVALVATGVSLVIGVTYGAVAGYVGSWVDNVMMRIVDVLYSIPFIFVVILLITVLSQEEIKTWLMDHGVDRITIFYFVVGAIYWLTMARVVRGQVISLKNEPFVEAARSLGASRMRVVFRHLVPNLMSVVVVYLTLTIPRVMLFEAFLSFLGLGVEPPDVSWGLLANEGLKAITPVRIYWWLVLFPSLGLGITLLALNFLGDGLRDALDPKLKNR